MSQQRDALDLGLEKDSNETVLDNIKRRGGGDRPHSILYSTIIRPVAEDLKEEGFEQQVSLFPVVSYTSLSLLPCSSCRSRVMSGCVSDSLVLLCAV